MLVDAGFLVAMLSRRDSYHKWAVQEASENSPPWYTCEAVLSEAYHLLGERGVPGLNAMLSRSALVARFNLDDNVDAVVAFLRKYASVPMSFADACLLRMSEIMDDPVVLTTDSDFRVYRRHGRQVVPVSCPR
ncbi:MAG TPA: PIN domain-containing protein [Bryobacteraceae bacterium]|nr:PIN domain-containing protein [Bryobacteraceae bacterium]